MDMFKVFNGKERFIEVQKEKYKDGRVKVHRVTQRVSHHHLSLSLSQPPPSVTIIITAKSRCTHQQGYFFLNVGRDPIGKEHETYCTMAYIEQEVEDKVQSVLYKAGHYAPAVADLYTGITSYCDSSGWAMPQLRVVLANLNGDFDISMVQAHNSSTTSYKNTTTITTTITTHFNVYPKVNLIKSNQFVYSCNSCIFFKRSLSLKLASTNSKHGNLEKVTFARRRTFMTFKTVSQLRSENKDLEQLVEVLEEVVVTFADGRFTDEIREVIMNLFALGNRWECQ